MKLKLYSFVILFSAIGYGQTLEWCDTIDVAGITDEDVQRIYKNPKYLEDDNFQPFYAQYLCYAKQTNNKKLLAYTSWVMAKSQTHNPYNKYATVFWKMAYKNINMIEDRHKTNLYAEMAEYFSAEISINYGMEILFEGIKFAKKRNNLDELLILNKKLASLHTAMYDFKKAEKTYEEIFKLSKKLNAPPDPWLIFHYGYFHRMQECNSKFKDCISKSPKGEDPTSVYHYKKALSLMNSMETKATVYNEIANAYVGHQKYDSAKIYAEKINFRKHCGDHQYIFNLIIKGSLYVRLNQNEKAKDSLKLALQLAKKNGYRDFQFQAYRKFLPLIASSPEEFNFHYDEYNNFCKELIYDYEKNVLFTENQEKLMEQSFELENSKLEKQAQEAINQRNTIVLIIILFFSALATLFYYRFSKKIKKSHEVIKTKHQDLMVAYKDIEVMNKKLDQFASIAAHDMKNSLSGIMMTSQLTKEKLENTDFEEVANDINEVEKETRKLIDFMNYLLQNAHQKPNKQKEIIKLPEIFNEVKKTLTIKSKEKKMKIEGNLPYEIEADFFEIYQLFLNFMENAIKYGINSKGIQPLLTVDATHENGMLIITFEDNGDGIPPEETKKILQQYYQIMREGEKVEGVGLGLHICSEIVKKYKGEIKIHSELGNGTKFIISLKINAVKIS